MITILNIECHQYRKPGMNSNGAKETDTNIYANCIHVLSGKLNAPKSKHDDLLIKINQ